ncbi:MAG: Fur family transcriptional regulator [Fusobacteriaceae bacterium]
MEKINIPEHLKSKGIKPSYQRIKIYEFLLNNKIHPTVDTIYKALSLEIPTLSKTTVYNTLDLFLENNLINIVVIDENQTRYDVNTHLHGHFQCKDCKEIYDLELPEETFNIISLKGFQIEESHLYFKGICKNCSIKN